MELTTLKISPSTTIIMESSPERLIIKKHLKNGNAELLSMMFLIAINIVISAIAQLSNPIVQTLAIGLGSYAVWRYFRTNKLGGPLVIAMAITFACVPGLGIICLSIPALAIFLIRYFYLPAKIAIVFDRSQESVMIQSEFLWRHISKVIPLNQVCLAQRSKIVVYSGGTSVTYLPIIALKLNKQDKTKIIDIELTDRDESLDKIVTQINNFLSDGKNLQDRM